MLLTVSTICHHYGYTYCVFLMRVLNSKLNEMKKNESTTIQHCTRCTDAAVCCNIVHTAHARYVQLLRDTKIYSTVPVM